MLSETIEKIETFHFEVNWITWVFVRITDSQGCHGWGEASLHGPVTPVVAAIEEYAQHLIGQEAHGAERHWHRLQNAWRWRGGAVFMTALSAIDMAIWDIEARRLGVPIARLLGGAHRTALPVYASHWMQDVETAEQAFDAAKEAVSRGFGGFKWCPFRFEMLRSDPYGSILRTQELMSAAREGAGVSAEIYIECGELLSPRSAPAMLDALAPFRPAWIEEPFPFEGPQAIARLQAETTISIAVGERLLSRYEFRELLETGGCRIVQPDIMHGGGFTELRRIAALAETYDVTVAPHNPAGPICTVASMHLAASVPNFLVLEQIEPDRAQRDAITLGEIEFSGGCFHLPEGPGLGIEMDVTKLSTGHPPTPPRKERAGSLFH